MHSSYNDSQRTRELFIANYITTDSETSIHKGKGHKLLFALRRGIAIDC